MRMSSSKEKKGSFDLKAWLESQPTELFEVAAITVAELWHGVERATRPYQARRRQFLETVLSALPINHHTLVGSTHNLTLPSLRARDVRWGPPAPALQ